MGLDITHAKSRFEYHAGYSALHGVRYLAYKHFGGTRSQSVFEGGSERMSSDGAVPLYDWIFVVTCVACPNLMMHSDCDGGYTLDGRVDLNDGTLQTGSSAELLRELRMIEPTAAKEGGRAAETYRMLTDLVADVVENHDGRIEFH